MSAQGSQSGISLRAETLWGELDPGQFQSINFVSEDLKFTKETKESDTVRPDRQTSELLDIDAECGGMITTEFQSGNVDFLLPAFLYDTGWHFVDGVGATGVITAGLTGSNLDFEIVAGSNLLSLGSSIVHDIIAGQVIRLENMSNAANNGFHVVVSVSTNDLTLATTTLVDEVIQSVATLKGDRIRNGVTKTSYQCEKSLNDVSQFFLYSGFTPNNLEFEIDAPIMCKLGFVGKDDEIKQVTSSSPAATALATTPRISSKTSAGTVEIDGVELDECSIQSITFTIENKAEGKKSVGTLGNCAVNAKSLSIKGAIALYFSDQTYYQKYKSATAFTLQSIMIDSLGNAYVLRLANCKFDDAGVNVSGREDDVMMEGSYVATVGSEGYTVQICRMLA